MNCNNTYENAIRKIEEAQECKPNCMYYIGATGPTGPQGPAGDGNSTCCDCVRQMRNIIQQIINLYPNSNLFLTLDSGDAVLGTPGSIIVGPNGDAGIFEIINSQANIRQLVSICNIDSIRISNAVYNEAITYLPEPDLIPTGCCDDCDMTIRSQLPVGTNNVSIVTNTQIPSQGNVIRNEYGMIVLQDSENNITFVSSCSISLIYITND